MCASCGCGPHARPAHDHEHDHAHDHAHVAESHGATQVLSLEHELLARNSQLAELNRAWLAGRGVWMINLLSSPGSGKTTLLEQTLRVLGAELDVHVIEGDQATDLDCERIRACGRPALQINTGAGCHLDAEMVGGALKRLNPPFGSTVVAENVGNLVCPALFDLGEHSAVVLLSVTEGDDKPLKYPHAFRAARLLVYTKLDLLPHVPFDLERCTAAARRINPGIQVIELSALTGVGMTAWLDWLRGRGKLARAETGAGARS
jgi:hydrogenase nickel incorporation protein HypB